MQAALKRVDEMDYEGIVLKPLDAPYTFGAPKDEKKEKQAWVKVGHAHHNGTCTTSMLELTDGLPLSSIVGDVFCSWSSWNDPRAVNPVSQSGSRSSILNVNAASVCARQMTRCPPGSIITQARSFPFAHAWAVTLYSLVNDLWHTLLEA